MMASPWPFNQRLHFLLLLLCFDLQFDAVFSTTALRQQDQVVLTPPDIDVDYKGNLNSSYSSQAPHLFASAQGLL